MLERHLSVIILTIENHIEGVFMKTNRAYVPIDAIARHQDFSALYADGDTLLAFKGPWASERDKVTVFGRLGGEMGRIQPDPKALVYYIKLERWEYPFHTRVIFKDYYVEGMRWQINGSLSKPPFDFVLEDDGSNDVHVSVTTLKGHGECFEVRARDVAKLRIAVTSVVAMAIKEEYCGLSEGEQNDDAPRLERLKRRIFSGKGKTYEEILREAH